MLKLSRLGGQGGPYPLPPVIDPEASDPKGKRELCGNPAASSGVLKKTNKVLGEAKC